MIDDNPFIKIVDFFPDQGEKLHKLSIQYGLEGIVEKNPESKYYLNHRSKEWRKLVNYHYTDCYIAGYRKDKLGLYLVDCDTMKPLGICELVPPNQARAFYDVAPMIKFSETRDKVLLEPRLKCRIKRKRLKTECLI